MPIRLLHMHTIALCFAHHQAQSPLPVGHAYHKGTALFKRRYGTNEELLEKQNRILEGITS